MKNYSGPAKIIVNASLSKTGKREVIQEHEPLNFFYIRGGIYPCQRYLCDPMNKDGTWHQVTTPNVGDACAFGELQADILSEYWNAEKVLVTDV